LEEEIARSKRPVAIIGGGYSGTILAAKLARLGVESFLVDGSGRMGRGTAYSTLEPAHLLNVAAHNMSAFADDPDDFAKRFEAAGGDRSDYAERRFYGQYLGDILDRAVASGHVECVRAKALSAERGDAGWTVSLDDGRTLESAGLVLAMGNQAPEPLPGLADAGPRYIADPWGEEARRAINEAVDEGGDILLIGTGLTMVDTVLSLDSAGFGGNILAVSRRGQMPRSHDKVEPAPVALEEVPKGSVVGLWRWLRKRSAQVGWRAAIDSLRPHSHPLWQSLSLDQQRRFLRHARPYWDVHRHRIAPRVAKRMVQLIAEGRLTVAAGRIVAARDAGSALEIEIRRRGAKAAETKRFAFVINCTGPLHSIGKTRDPLLRALLDSGSIAPDALGIGLEVEDGARVAGAENLWAMGGLTKGLYWEIIAVPDIRHQAAGIAAQIVEEIGHD
jgi:uncharacterized NAD(P)/FAD-binding protein YdhS